MSTEPRRLLFAHMPIQRKLGLAFGSILALFAATCAMVFVNYEQSAEARRLTSHTYEVLERFAALYGTVADQQVGHRGFLLTRDPAYLQPYEKGESEFEEIWTQLKGLTADTPEQQQRLDRVRVLVQQWRAQAAEPSIEAVRLGEASPMTLVTGAAGKRLLDEVADELFTAEEQERALLVQRNSRMQLDAERLRLTIGAMLALGLLVGGLAMRLSTRLITQPVVQLTELMTRLSQNDYGFEIPGQERADELGAIARSLQIFKKLTIERTDINWVKTHAGAISGKLQATRSQAHFAETLLEELAPLLNAGMALLFVWREDAQRLEPLGSYGFKDTRKVTVYYGLGDGLVGQVAKERRPIYLSGVPDDYARIQSGLGASPPRALAVLPVTSQDELLGVLEIGSFSRFNPVQQRLLEELLPLVALGLQNLGNALKTERLLEETQAQAQRLKASEEELRAQQEELRATNESLRDKSETLEQQSRRLQSNEEELRAQSEELRVTNTALQETAEQQRAQQRALEQAQATLEEKALALERASQYKSDFLANMSHELRTPLNSMLILSRSLADNDEGNLNSEQVESARIVHDSGKNLLALINDILDLSKVEAGKMEAVAEDFTPAEFAAQLERSFRPIAGERKLDFDIALAADLPPMIRSDAAKLNQIATNLLSNAFKFTHEGGVRLEMRRPQPDTVPRVAGLTDDNAILLRCTDSGIGMPPDKLARMFQAFEQGDTSTSRRYGGTGLGLSICKGLSHLLGGDIAVASEPGKGSVFSVVIPESLDGGVASARPARPAGPLRERSVPALPLPAAQRTGETSILVVEDDVQFANVLAGMARARGYRTLIAHGGEAGLALAQQHQPAGILLDIGLPDISGWQVMERLRQSAQTAGIPVHFISGADEGARARETGAAGFLKKPVSREQVEEVIDSLLQPGAGGRRRLLLIDDSEEDRQRVRQMLRKEDVEIDEASSAEEALSRMAQRAYDLLILDLGLPGIDGFEFLETASRRGQLPPVVIHSRRELSREEGLKLREYTDAIVMKNAHATQRLLDEATLFLHSIHKRVAPVAAPPKPATPQALGGKTVLIVDDDMRNIFALSKTLRARGLKVVMAQDGPKALTQIENNPDIDIVLMDIMMPGMDGYEAMRRIRARPEWLKLPIIAVTAKAMVGDREKCIEAGANDYCSKPIDVELLVPQIQQLL